MVRMEHALSSEQRSCECDCRSAGAQAATVDAIACRQDHVGARMTATPSRSRTHGLMAFENAIAECLETGQYVPCQGDDRRYWTSDDPYEIDAAVLACRSCPVLSACATYVTQWPEGPGVWAGAYRLAPSSWSGPL